MSGASELAKANSGVYGTSKLASCKLQEALLLCTRVLGSATMDDQSQLIIKGKNGYLLVEEANSKLFLPYSKLDEGEDFHAAAYRCLNKVDHIVTFSLVKFTKAINV